jgi:peptidoglycan/xylan/chitin deacetylase (PgdA/CDA1 family)
MYCHYHPPKLIRKVYYYCGRHICSKGLTLYGKALTLSLFKSINDIARQKVRSICPVTSILVSGIRELVTTFISKLYIDISENTKTLKKHIKGFYAYYVEFYIERLITIIAAASVERVKKLPLKEGAILSITSISFVFIYSGILAETSFAPPHIVSQERSENLNPNLKDVAANLDQKAPGVRKLDGRAGVGLSVVKVKRIKFEKAPLVDLMRIDNAYKEPAMVFIPPDIYRGRIDKKELSITFDGGAGAAEAEEVLRVLRQRNIKTTIFLAGGFIKNYPRLVRQTVKDGHEIGNHTMSHSHLTSFAMDLRHTTLPGVDKNFIDRELREAARLFKLATGEEMAPLWRAPYGEVNEEIRRWAFEAGYIHVNWTRDYKRKETLDSLDWVDDEESQLYYSAEKIKKKILNFGKDGNGVGGGIVLMHLGTTRKSDRAVSILGEIIDELEGRGYRFVKVSELLEGDKNYDVALKMLPKSKMLARLDTQ